MSTKITVYQGDTKRGLITVTNTADGQELDLTLYSARFTMSKYLSDTNYLIDKSLNKSDNKFILELSNVETAQNSGTYVWEVKVTNGTDIARVLGGQIEIKDSHQIPN
jgi:hypothetical protein